MLRKTPRDELREALDAPFPRAWREVLDRRVPFYRSLSDAEQERIEDKIQHFILTKVFTSPPGLAITDEMRVVAATAACRLTLNLSWLDYANLGYVSLRSDDSWRHEGRKVVGLGDRWKVTLSWPQLLHGMAEPRDGYNVGYHEFAHALEVDGALDGAPTNSSGLSKTHVLANARAQVASAIRLGQVPPIDEYAATSDAEVFAVGTEWFFERPHDLRASMPALYDLLQQIFNQDPVRTATDDNNLCRSSRPKMSARAADQLPSFDVSDLE
jgi:Mlc titration factor MtfA (ptsG expression regulator)